MPETTAQFPVFRRGVTTSANDFNVFCAMVMGEYPHIKLDRSVVNYLAKLTISTAMHGLSKERFLGICPFGHKDTDLVQIKGYLLQRMHRDKGAPATEDAPG